MELSTTSRRSTSTTPRGRSSPTRSPTAPRRSCSGARESRGLIAPGAKVAGTVERSVLGRGVVVEAGAAVRDSVLLPGAVVRAGATVERAILDDGVAIGRDATVGEAGGEIALVGLRASVPAGERLPAGARHPHPGRLSARDSRRIPPRMLRGGSAGARSCATRDPAAPARGRSALRRARRASSTSRCSTRCSAACCGSRRRSSTTRTACAEPLGREGRRSPGVERVDGVADDRAVVRRARGARPGQREAARVAGAPRDQPPARPARPRAT